MTILSGFGRIDLTVKGSNIFTNVKPMAFSIQGAADIRKSSKYVDGYLVNAGTKIASRTWSMQLGVQDCHWLALQVGLQELAQNTAAVSLPTVRYATVPAATPFEIVDADIVDTNVFASVDSTRGVSLSYKTGTTPASGEYCINTTTNKLIFNSDLAGSRVAYRLLEDFTNLSSIGHESVYTTFASYSFSGIIYLDNFPHKVVVPSLETTAIPEFDFSEVTQLNMTFDLVNEGNDRLPFRLYQLPANYKP